MLTVKNRVGIFFIFLPLFLAILISLNHRPAFAAFVWDKNSKDIEEIRVEVEKLKSILKQVTDTIRDSVLEGTKPLIRAVEEFKQEVEALREDKKEIDDKLETLRDEMQGFKADIKVDIGESIQSISMETEDRIGRIEVSNTNAIGNLQRSLDVLSTRLDDWDRTVEEKEKELTNTFAEKVTSLEFLISESLKKRDNEISAINSTLRVYSEDRDNELSSIESTLNKSLIERDREIISLISNIQQELEERVQGFNTLRGTVDNINKRLDLLSQKLSSLDEASSPVEEESTKYNPEPKVIKTGPSGKLTESEIFYSKAQKAIKDKNYDSALQFLKDFLTKYPDTDLSDNAQYWIGEVYYDQKDFSNAILAFDMVINRYPEGDKLPDALLKEGLSFYNLGKLEIAKIFLERVTEGYPKTRFATIAGNNLKKIAKRIKR
ncbi:MAG: tol-pal system protein YbgF [Thermodesulfobacteriota bacterium]